jgi:hypothetical protein
MSKTVYVIFSPTKSGVFEPQVIYEDAMKALDALSGIKSDDYRLINFEAGAVQPFVQSGLELLEASTNYKEAHDAARFKKGTLWEMPVGGNMQYVVTRKGSHVAGLYELVSFEAGTAP